MIHKPYRLCTSDAFHTSFGSVRQRLPVQHPQTLLGGSRHDDGRCLATVADLGTSVIRRSNLEAVQIIRHQGKDRCSSGDIYKCVVTDWDLSLHRLLSVRSSNHGAQEPAAACPVVSCCFCSYYLYGMELCSQRTPNTNRIWSLSPNC